MKLASDTNINEREHEAASLVFTYCREICGLGGQPVADGDQTSTIIYTSGTTGQPKGVVHSFNTMAWGVSSATQRVRMDVNDRYIS